MTRNPKHHGLRIALAAAMMVGLSTAALQAQGRWTESNVGLNGAMATAVAFDSSGGVLLGTDCGVYRWMDGSWSTELWFGPVSDVRVMSDGTALAIAIGLSRHEPGDRYWGMPQGTVYSIIVTGARSLLAAYSGGLFRSGDRGRTWERREPLLNGHVRRLERTPDGTVFAIGDSVWTSADGGVNWTVRALAPAPDPIAILPISHDRVLMASDSLRLSSDGGRTWRAVSADRYTHIRRGADGSILAIISPASPAGGAWAGVVELDTNGTIVDRIRPGMFDYVDRRNDGLMVMSTGSDVLIGVGGEMRLSTDGLGCARLDTVAMTGDGRMYTLLFGGPRPAPGRIQRGTLFRSDDSGRTWTRTAMHGDQILGAFSSGEVFLRSHNDTTGSPELSISRDWGATTREMPVSGGDMRAFGDNRGTAAVSVSRVLPDSIGRLLVFTDTAGVVSEHLVARFPGDGIVADSVLVMAGVMGSESDGIWRSTDRGATWSLCMEAPQRASLQRAPNGSLYTVAAAMLFRSTDVGATWSRLTTLTGAARTPILFGSGGVLVMSAAVGDTALIRSDDGGYEWRLVSPPWRGAVTMTGTADGAVIAYRMATDSLRVWASDDGGDSFQAAAHAPLASGVSFVTPWREIFARRYPERLYRLDRIVTGVETREVPANLDLR